MFAGRLNVTNALDFDNKTNQTETLMTNENVQIIAELFLLDYFKIARMIFTTVILMLYGWVILRRRQCQQPERTEPEEETAPTQKVKQTIMTPEDEATLHTMFKEVMTLRELTNSLKQSPSRSRT